MFFIIGGFIFAGLVLGLYLQYKFNQIDDLSEVKAIIRNEFKSPVLVVAGRPEGISDYYFQQEWL